MMLQRASTVTRARLAIEAGSSFLRRQQSPTGEFPVDVSYQEDMTPPADPDATRTLVGPSIFPTALILRALPHLPCTAAIAQAAADYLHDHIQPGGVWKHWTHQQMQARMLPPDADDTACVASALSRFGFEAARTRAILLANRDRRGRFLTWILARARWRGLDHARATWLQLFHLPSRIIFFRITPTARDDMDAVVNANVLHFVGDYPDRDVAEQWLLDIVRHGDEHRCDKYYDDPAVVRYFFSHALAGRRPEARAALVARTLASEPATALHLAMAMTILTLWREPVPEAWRKALLDQQASDGGWPKRAIYLGGRARRSDGLCEPATADAPRWGSRALTSAFCLEALASG